MSIMSEKYLCLSYLTDRIYWPNLQSLIWIKNKIFGRKNVNFEFGAKKMATLTIKKIQSLILNLCSFTMCIVKIGRA